MKKLSVLLIISMVGFFQYCSSTKKTTSTATRTPLTYVANVQPTIIANCSPCHIPPKGFKKALDSYDAAKTNIDDMLRRINLNPADKGFMPFKHPKLSDSVINVFVQWKGDGLLEK
jgi:hypothetical protein